VAGRLHLHTSRLTLMQVAESVNWNLVTDSYSCSGDSMPSVAGRGGCSLTSTPMSSTGEAC
jgi:hypothetical protein